MAGSSSRQRQRPKAGSYIATAAIGLNSGDAGALLRTLEKTGRREGIGELLAERSRTAAARVGQESEVWAMHVQGLQLPGYDPRRLGTLALGLAVASRAPRSTARSPSWLERHIDAYYAVRGWDIAGRPVESWLNLTAAGIT